MCLPSSLYSQGSTIKGPVLSRRQHSSQAQTLTTTFLRHHVLGFSKCMSYIRDNSLPLNTELEGEKAHLPMEHSTLPINGGDAILARWNQFDA
jgi:hypothetical protein